MNVAVAILIAVSLQTGPKSLSADDVAFFEKQVRPLLAEHCYSCHGSTKQKAGLRLDSRAAFLKGSESGPIVKPGAPDESLFIQAIRHKGDVKMPPSKPLAPAAVEILTHWVKRGAPWPEVASKPNDDAWKRHWAFQPIQNPTAPKVQNTTWVRTSIDSFILARLEAQKLTPSPVADRRTLIRRVTFDLTGLPPTPEEVEAFVNDKSTNAYEKVVDRLLKSPHYGERWARHWLDVARYSDTKGYVFFEDGAYPWAWTYRDYVITAFNEDVPFDRFVTHQLAADKLDLGKDRGPLRALGFLTLGGRFMNNSHDILDDRIDVVTRGLLGLTVTCARCHDHKFDPLTQRDYYGLYGIFASSVEPNVPPLYSDPPTTPAYEAFVKELQTREAKLDEFVQAKQREVVGGAKKRAAEYLLAAHAMRNQPSTQEFMLLADGNDINPAMLSRWRAYLDRTRRTKAPALALWHRSAETPEAELEGLCKKLKDERGLNSVLVAAFTEKPTRTMIEVAHRYAESLQAIDKEWTDALEAARKANRPLPTTLSDPAKEELRQVFYASDAPPNVRLDLFEALSLLPDRPSQAKLQELRKGVEQWRATGPGAPPRAMALVDAPTNYDARVFLRGNPLLPGEAAPRQTLALLRKGKDQPFTDGSGRLELAKSIVDPKNPLTARVFVNRVWMHHFGTGLVHTPSDFGLRSEPPTHPELLDHLASEFIADGWSIKKLHRRIVLSATYQQQSLDRPEARRVDPENALLWRMNRRRLDFESLRDSLLAVSGRLDPTVGGPSIKDLLSKAANRRTLYGHIDRLNILGLYRTFDFPSPDASSPQRDSTTVPQQALFLMNHPFVGDCAKKMAARPDLTAIKDREAKVERSYRLCFGRAPRKSERELAEAFLKSDGDATALWEQYLQALLLTNEFAFVD